MKRAVTQSDGAGPRTGRRWQQRTKQISWRSLSLVLGLAILTLMPALGHAQRSDTDIADSGLTPARVRALATATRTERAGWQLPVLTQWQTYVPASCVGTRRCPLVMGSVHGMVAAADKYGFIISHTRPLQELLGALAIDPEKIAVMGDCGSMPWVMAMVANNPDVFSRAVMTTGPNPPATGRVAPPTGRTEFYIDHALLDGFPTLITAHQLRRAGHPVTVNVTPKKHGGTTYEYHDRVGQWLAESWAIPDPAARPKPETVAEVELTPEALSKLTIFWGQFKKYQMRSDSEPDLPLIMDRMAHQRVVALPYPDSEIRPVARLMDVPTLAAKHDAIADLLEQAGLTAQEHDEYRIALLNAYMLWSEWRNNRMPVLTNSVLGRNVAFIDTHPDEMIALEETSMFVTP